MTPPRSDDHSVPLSLEPFVDYFALLCNFNIIASASAVLYIFYAYLTVNFYVSSNDFGIIEVEFDDGNFLYGLYGVQ